MTNDQELLRLLVQERPRLLERIARGRDVMARIGAIAGGPGGFDRRSRRLRKIADIVEAEL